MELRLIFLQQKVKYSFFSRPNRNVYIRISSDTSGNSSKLDVSSIERTSTGIAAGLSRICSQSTPRKNGMDFSSSIPRFDPMRRSDSQQNFTIVSFASSEIGVSGGKINVSRQFITFLYVSCGLSEQNGGYPMSISYIITPNDHQSHAGP